MIITITINPSVDRLYHINKLKPGSLNRVDLKKHMVGGKGFNAGRVSSLLGSKTIVSGFIGGENGKFIEHEAKQDLYETLFINTKKETRNCLQIIDDQGTKTEINENGLAIDPHYYEELMIDLKKLLINKKITAISLNGSLPKGCSYQYYLELIQLIRKTKPNCYIILDTSGNILNQILDTDILPDIIKPNEHEIAEYLNKPVVTDPLELMHYIEKNTKLNAVPIIFVSLGAKGCLVKYHNNYYYAIQKPVEAVNSEGSGDSMVGGILSALDKNSDITKTIQYACAAGTANAMNIKTGFIDKKIFEELVPDIKIEKLK
ncbi:1-phosphofructokinase family hexose kinase [uncultured Lactobacillus sp.]|uniref:1-phosphofructokinase family hexose kinase n=1 Tax=uncultured Lactobacillus sp. TaxID=153152 RepID=UPI002616BE5C|nr:1-phosphofructokinase family hexose kinase [uncultured Lactobacillus sp.]